MITPLIPYQVALIETRKTKTMVITDLHLGWEMSLSQRGIHVPSQSPKLLQKLKNLILTYKPKKLVILGDIKHTIATAKMFEWQDVPNFFNELKKQIREIEVIRGNHDGNLEPLLPENIRILPSTGLVMEEIGLFHGHRWPSPLLLKCKTLIMGHVHPVIAFRDPAGFRIREQVWVKVKCDGVKLAQALLPKHRVKIEKSVEDTLWKRYKVKPETKQLFIMPSFNDFLGGRPLNKRKPGDSARARRIMGPILRSEAVNMENAEIYLLDGTFLGTLSQLRTLG